MNKKEERIKKIEQKATRESAVFHAMAEIKEFKKEHFNGDYGESIFWSAIYKIESDRRIERKAQKDIADAEEKLASLKSKYSRHRK